MSVSFQQILFFFASTATVTAHGRSAKMVGLIRACVTSYKRRAGRVCNLPTNDAVAPATSPAPPNRPAKPQKNRKKHSSINDDGTCTTGFIKKNAYSSLQR
ncbi:hypothetical protein EVAR_43901_1 [Eumeta japonica]|uniref:Secreted protein n=1 Tax=Eumeta variegata TaxID=151549 RepID=A0A4C1WPC5_EUMVA|nr:hypothetical protein EVAR_43901_1 [Eumeta japonica]